MGKRKQIPPWFHWVMLAVVCVILAGGVEAGITRDLRGVVKSLGYAALYLWLWMSLVYPVHTERAPRIWVLQAFLLAAATGSYWWLWRFAHARWALVLLVAMAVPWAAMGFQWFRHRPR
jgi:hypothetical protein